MVVFLTEGFVCFDSIAETMNVPPDHTFGACLRPEDYGKYPDFLLTKQTTTPPHPTSGTQLSSPCLLKASNFRGLRYHVNISEKSL